jgi:hypothetical protein
LADLPPSLRKQFSDRDAEAASKAAENVDKQWLPDLLRVLKRETRGAIHIGLVKDAAKPHLDSKIPALTIWHSDNRHRAIAQAAGLNIFLDATLNREKLALMLGCDPSEILVVCQQSVPIADLANLDLIQVNDLGRMGAQRGNHQQQRAGAIITHYKLQDPTTKVIDFKINQADGAWFRDSRGINDFLQTKTLILVGTPCPNLAELMAQFAILTGEFPREDNEEFQRFVDEVIEAEFMQAIGRLRANRRPDEQLQIIIISDFELSIPTGKVTGKEITIAAASKLERTQQLIIDAVAQLKAANQKVTQTAVAAITGLTQGYISRFRTLLQTLLEPSNSKSNNPALDTLTPLLESAITDCDDLPQTLETIDNFFHQWLTSDIDRLTSFEQLNRATQTKILAALMAILPQDIP